MFAAGAVPARAQMAASLGFHIVLACFGIAFPAVTLVANWIGIRRSDPAALLLARRWSKVMAVVFSVGAVSGTVLSYEMGLLWPGLMGRFGAAIGIPFSVEGIFFFVEAVFIGVYLYGWRRLSPWAHWWSGVPIVVAGMLSALCVVAANSWMNQPSGFVLRDGHVTAVSPLQVFFNRATPFEVPHMILAAYMVAGFVIAGVYAVGMLRGRRDRYHRFGFLIPFWIAAIVTPLQILMGDEVARAVSQQQPVKFATMELIPHTHRGVTEWLGGIYYNGQVYFGVGVPRLDSILVGFSPTTKVTGWDSVPANLRPPLPSLMHLSFDAMVAIGFGLLALAAWQGWVWYFHRRLPRSRWFLIFASISGFAAVVAMECGWIVTEVGRQPWIVYQVLRTRDAVTPATGVPVTLATIVVLYLILTALTIGVPWLMGRRWRTRETQQEEQENMPYGPQPTPEPRLSG